MSPKRLSRMTFVTLIHRIHPGDGGTASATRRHPHRTFIAATWAVATAVARAQAQAVSETPTALATIAPAIHVISSSSGNLIVRVGAHETLIVGVQSPELVARARAFISQTQAAPVRLAVAAELDNSAAYGDGGWGKAGAVTFAQEVFRARTRSDC